MNYYGKSVLVTGGYGFIGSNLVHDLVKLGAKVTVIDNFLENTSANLLNLSDIKGKFEYFNACLTDSKVVNEVVKNKEIIFHLAGQTSHTIAMNDPLLDLKANVISTLSLLEACRLNNPKVKLISASTRQVYGKPVKLPIDENHELNPPDVNAIHNITADNYLLLYDKIFGINSIIFRLTNTFGPRQNMKRNSQQVLPIFFRQVIEGKEISIFGDGEQIRDFNYVTDVSHAFLIGGLANVHGEIFNLGNKNHKSLLEIAKSIIKINGSGSYRLIPFPEERKKIDVGDTYLDYSKVESLLGWKPEVSFERAVLETLDYFKGRGVDSF